MLSRNPNAIHLLEKNQDKIDWWRLSENPNAIHLLEQNLDKINWSLLSKNANAIYLLEKNPDKFIWSLLSQNPNILTLDYEVMCKQCMPLCEELMQKVFSPSNLVYYLNQYNYDINLDEYN